MLFSKAIEGYNFNKATTYSKATLQSYHFVFRNLIAFAGDRRSRLKT
jgi:hypothetical protein